MNRKKVSMDFISLVEARQSTRKFDPEKKVKPEDILFCLEAMRLSPSASNAQPYFFHVCEAEKAKQVAKATQSAGLNRFSTDAPVQIVICEAPYNATASLGARFRNQDYRSVDIGIAAIHFVLAAAEKGLGTCMLGWFDEKRIQEILGVSDRIRLVISVGYAKDEPLRRKKRKSLDQLTDFIANKEVSSSQ
jgi:nitroreductase